MLNLLIQLDLSGLYQAGLNPLMLLGSNLLGFVTDQAIRDMVSGSFQYNWDLDRPR